MAKNTYFPSSFLKLDKIWFESCGVGETSKGFLTLGIYQENNLAPTKRETI